jgi:glycosyltransferase involved in cell wall biosynthesis
MIRVLHIIDHLGLGGAQSALLDMVTGRDASVVNAEVASMHGNGMFFDALERAGVPVHSLSPSKWPPAYLPRLARLVRRGSYDILHFHLQGANWIAKPFCAALSSTPRVAHDHSSADILFRGWWSLLPDGLCHLFSDRVVAVSRGVADFLVRCEAVPRRKIRVLANGVDTQIFSPAVRECTVSVRAALGIGSDVFVVGALGRLAPEKNLEVVVELARLCPEMFFVIGGSGPQEQKLRRLASSLPNCRLLGMVKDRPRFYAALDAFVLPSLHEALPMTILEAMSCEIPVVASHLEGVASALGDAGVLVAPGDAGAIASELTLLKDNALRRTKMGSAARQRAVERFDSALTAEKIAAIYLELMEN